MMVYVMMHDEGKIHKYVPAAQPTKSLRLYQDEKSLSSIQRQRDTIHLY